MTTPIPEDRLTDTDRRSHWNYRVIESSQDGETWRSIHEVYYTNHVPTVYTVDPVPATWMVEEGDPDGAIVMLDRMREALAKPVLTPADFHRPGKLDLPVQAIDATPFKGVDGLEYQQSIRDEWDRPDDWLSLADALAQHGDDANIEFDAPCIPPATNIVTLGIDSERAVTARFAAAMKGEAQGSLITFASPELLFQTFTQPRWHIVKAMTGVGPLSLPEVARRVGCDVEAVHNDVRALLKTGVLESTVRARSCFRMTPCMLISCCLLDDFCCA